MASRTGSPLFVFRIPQQDKCATLSPFSSPQITQYETIAQHGTRLVIFYISSARTSWSGLVIYRGELPSPLTQYQTNLSPVSN